jgi:hypothetical protein
MEDIMKTINLKLSYYMAMAAIAFLFIVTLCTAEEIRYPVPCYEGEELAKIREWEKGTGLIGKKIDHTNVDKLKEYLIDTYYEMIKNPDDWGENWFRLTHYEPYIPHKGWIEWTKKGMGKCSVDKDGFLNGHISGTPFPNPKTGTEVIYNYEILPTWDDRRQTTANGGFAIIVDYRTGGTRSLQTHADYARIAERTILPPIPEHPNNKKGIRFGFLHYFWDPPELQGLYQLDLHYKDRSREWDSWVWVPAIRRIRRVDTTQRQDHRGGSDTCPDDFNAFQARIARFTYELIDKKELLCGRRVSHKELVHVEGRLMWQNMARERIKTFVVKAISKDPQYLYSRQIFYIDPEYWNIQMTEKYDKQNQLWKIGDYAYGRYPAPNGEIIADYCTGQIMDVQRKHGLYAANAPMIYYPNPLPLSNFKPSALNKLGR